MKNHQFTIGNISQISTCDQRVCGTGVSTQIKQTKQTSSLLPIFKDMFIGSQDEKSPVSLEAAGAGG